MFLVRYAAEKDITERLWKVKYKGKNIYDVLNMTVEEAVKFFEHVPSIRRKMETLNDVGLSYIRLGQPSTELSGGEAQRIKLGGTELSKRSYRKDSIYSGRTYNRGSVCRCTQVDGDLRRWRITGIRSL